MVSLANPPLELIAGPDQTPELARMANDALAELCRRHADRFPGLRRIAADEQRRGFARRDRPRGRTISARCGVQLFTNVAGKPLSAPDFRPIFQRMAAHDLPVWVHPMRGPNFPDYAGEQASEAEIWFSFGWPYETTACMTRLIYSRLLDELPDLKIITHHMGGMIPYFAGKINLGFRQIFFGTPRAQPVARRTPASSTTPIDYYKMLYADTALNGEIEPTRCGHAFFGTSSCLFATDAPFDAEQGRGLIRDTIRAVEALPITAGRARHDLRRQCARAAQAAGDVTQRPGARHENAEHRVKLRDGEMGAYLAIPDRTPAGAVIAIMEIWGVNETMRRHAHEFAEAGFICLVPDLFWRQEPGVELSDHDPEHVQARRSISTTTSTTTSPCATWRTPGISWQGCRSATARSARSATVSAASSAI